MAALYTSFDINEKECKVLSLKHHKNQFSIEGFFTVPFQETSEEDAQLRARAKGETLKSALKASKCHPGESVLIIPKHSVTVRHSFLPSVADSELTHMARFEAEKHIPFNVERHIISHFLMKKVDVTGSHVLISAVDSPVIEEHLGILTSAGIQPVSATVSSVSLYNFFRFLVPEVADDITIALIHIGLLSVDFVIINKGIMTFTRSTSTGLEKLLSEWNELPGRSEPVTLEDIRGIDMADPGSYFHPKAFIQTEDILTFPGDQEEPAQTIQPSGENQPEEVAVFNRWKKKLIQSIRQTYDFARREFDCPAVSRIYLSGEGAGFQNVTSYLTGNLGVEVEILHDTQRISGLDRLPAAYFPALGAALEPFCEKGIRLNTLSERYIESQEYRRKRKNIISIAVMIIAVLVLAVLNFRSYSLRQEALTRWYKKEINKLDPEVRKLVDMQKKTRIISSYVRDEKNALAILDRISTYSYLPRKVSITDFKYKKDEIVEISGHAITIKDLNRFIGDLEESGFFREVHIKQRPWKNLPSKRPKVLNYTLLCQFKGEKD